MNPYFGIPGLTEYTGNPIDEQQKLADAKHLLPGLAPIANAAASMPITLLAPDPRLTELTGGPAALNYVPGAGAVETGAGALAGVIDAAGVLRNYFTGRNDDWKLPGMETLRKLGEHGAETQKEIQHGIEYGTGGLLKVPGDDAEGQFADSLGSMLGMGLSPHSLATAVRLAVPLTAVNEGGASLDEYNQLKAEAKAAGIPMPQSNVVDPATQLQLDAQSRNEPTPAPPPTQVAEAAPRVASDTRPPVIDLGLTTPTAPAKTEPQAAPAAPIDIGLSGSSNEPIDVGLSDEAVPMQQGQGVGTMGVGSAFAAILGTGIAIRAGRGLRERNAGITEAQRAARINDPAYAARVADYQNAQIAKGAGAISQGGEQAIPAPIPMANAARTGLNRANNTVFDKTARDQEIIRNVATPTNAQALAHQYGLLHDDGYNRTRFDAFLDTGYHPDTGIQVPSPDRQYRAIAKLDDARQATLMEGLGAANEQNNRTNNRASFRQGNPGATPTIEDIRHDFKHVDDAGLQTKVDAMMNDLELRRLAENHWAIEKGMREIGHGMGVLPTEELRRLNAAHPHHISETDTTGKVMAPLSQRDRTLFAGVEQMNSKPWDAQSQAIEGIHHEFEQRRFNKQLYDNIMEAQTRYPQMAKLIEPTTAPPDKPVYYSGGSPRESKMAIHTDSGTKWIKFNNADVANMFTGDSLKRQHIVAEATTIPRRIYQNFTTGVGSLASGSFAAARNLGYTIPAMSINTPKGMNAGIIHKAVRTATGGRWDSGVARGLDMFTNPATAAYAYGRGVADRRVHNLANMLDRNASNPINSMLRSARGDLAVDNMQKALDKFYRDSVTYEIQAKAGVGGGGYGPKSELRPLGLEASKRASIAAAQHVPQLFHSGGAWMGVKPAAIRLHTAVVDALSHISDAGHDAFYRLNRDTLNADNKFTDPRLSYETRALTGNPSTSGESKILKAVTDRLPFTNIALQGGARALRSVGERPLNSAMAMVTGLGTLKLISLLSAMQSPETFKNYQDELSTQEHSGNIIIYLPNGKPWMIPLAQEFQIPATLIESLVANAVNVVAMNHDPLTFQSVHKMLLDFLGGHVSTSMVNQLKYGAGSQVSPFLNAPLIGQFDPYKMMQGDSMWESFRGTFASGPAANTLTLPNQTPDTLLEGVDGKDWTKVMGAVFGLAGTAMMEHVNALGPYLHQFGNWSDALGQVGHDWVQRAGDRNRILSPLMDHQMRMSLMPPIVEQTERDLKWMKGISGSRTEPAAEGTTGRGRVSLPTYTQGDPKIPTDPTMKFMWSTIEAANRRIAPQQTAISAMRKQMASVATHGMGVEQRRAWMNNATRDLADKYRYIQDIIQDTNYTMSKALNRNIHVGMKVDWQKGPEQFMDAD
jgi:hypothetical protein